MKKFLSGKVVKGLQIGKKIGFPTINIELEEVPYDLSSGVYICLTKINGPEYKSVLHFGPKSIGTDDKKKIFCEVHLIDFNEDVYGEEIQIKLLKKIRDVREFLSERQLKEQIAQDVEITKKYFNAKKT